MKPGNEWCPGERQLVYVQIIRVEFWCAFCQSIKKNIEEIKPFIQFHEKLREETYFTKKTEGLDCHATMG